MEMNDQVKAASTVPLTDEEANAMYGKIASMMRARLPIDFEQLTRDLHEICWNPEEVIQAIKQACKDLVFPHDTAHWMLYMTPSHRVLLVGRLPGFGQRMLQVACEFSLKLQENLFKIDKFICAGPQQYPQQHPRLGLWESGYNPGQTYGPIPTEHHGFSTQVFKPGVGFYKQSRVDLLVTKFEEVKPYFEILEKRKFDMQHEMAIFETIMQRSCGPDLRSYWRFIMIGRWDEGQDVGALITLESHEIGSELEETKLSTYQTAVGTYLDFQLQYPPYPVPPYRSI